MPPPSTSRTGTKTGSANTDNCSALSGIFVTPGGAYRFHMRSPEGTEHRSQGVFREIVEPARLVLTGAWVEEEGKPGHETLLTVSFADHGGKTKLTLHQAVFESVTARDAHRGGWTS